MGDRSAMNETVRDLEWGNFTGQGPWNIDLDALVWRAEVGTIRDAVRAEVPRQARARRIPPFGRLVVVVFRLGSAIAPWWWRRRRGRFADASESRADLSRRLRVAIEHLGATYIKLAQIISSGEGLFPAELVNEFAKCRDRVPPEPWHRVRAVLADELGDLSRIFAELEESPLAAASIAQVHRARLADGTEVVVKIQRPSVAVRVRKDLRVMAWLAPFMVGRIKVAALANPPALVELFAETILEELDFRLEAENMIDVAAMLHELGLERFLVPRPHGSLVTRRVLVMERLAGFAFDDAEGMRAAGIDTEEVVRGGMAAFLEGAIIHGVFHGDLHGGNLFVLPDGRTALLDFGIIGRLAGPRRLAFMRLMLSAATSDIKGQVGALVDLGALPRDTDIDEVIVDLRLDEPIDPTTLSGEELVAEVQRIVKSLLGFGARMPKELMLFAKNMVFLDGAIARLAPDLDLIEEVSQLSLQFTMRHGERLARDLGVAAESLEINMDSFKAGLGVDLSAESLTYRELKERRDLIQKRMRDHLGK